LATIISPAVSLKLTETESIVEDWLRKLGLTSQEVLGALSLGRLNSPMRRKVIRACLGRLNMTMEQINRALDFYAITSVKAKGSTPPVVDELI
jgi:hypothetical protein